MIWQSATAEKQVIMQRVKAIFITKVFKEIDLVDVAKVHMVAYNIVKPAQA